MNCFNIYQELLELFDFAHNYSDIAFRLESDYKDSLKELKKANPYRYYEFRENELKKLDKLN